MSIFAKGMQQAAEQERFCSLVVSRHWNVVSIAFEGMGRNCQLLNLRLCPFESQLILRLVFHSDRMQIDGLGCCYGAISSLENLLGILQGCFYFGFHLWVVITQVTGLAEALGVELARGVLAVDSHLYPALRVIAIAAHASCVIVCLSVRALVDHFPVLHTIALLFRFFYGFLYLLYNNRCILWFRLARFATWLGYFWLSCSVDLWFRLLDLYLHTLVFMIDEILAEDYEGILASIHPFWVLQVIIVNLIIQRYCLSCVNMWFEWLRLSLWIQILH